MRKTTSKQQENEHGLPGSIIAMDHRSVNRLCSPLETATVGTGALERGDRAEGSSRDQPKQCVFSRSCWPNRNKRCSSVYASASLHAGQKSGKKRRDLEVSTCFVPRLRWVLRLWRSEKRHLPLVLDATSPGHRWTILAISVVLSGCAIPVAWKVIPAEQPGSWRPYWEGLLDELGKAVPPEWDVLVVADRGLYARWLWDAIVAWGWHPFLRINVGSKARVPAEENFAWISRWVPTPGTSWQGKVECFASKKGRVNGTLLMRLRTWLCVSVDDPDRPGT
jgi:hypothetical protein